MRYCPQGLRVVKKNGGAELHGSESSSGPSTHRTDGILACWGLGGGVHLKPGWLPDLERLATQVIVFKHCL